MQQVLGLFLQKYFALILIVLTSFGYVKPSQANDSYVLSVTQDANRISSLFVKKDFKNSPNINLETGGTVFSIANFGSFLDTGSKFYNGWDSNGWDPNFYSIVRGYHLFKNQVDSTMASIKKSGQAKIGILVWFVGDHPEKESLGHFITTNQSQLYPQHKKNIQDFVRHADELGFNEVQIRFGSQGDADVFSTSAANMAAQIKHHWTFIQDVHASISELNLKIKVMYDLGGELAAHSTPAGPKSLHF